MKRSFGWMFLCFALVAAALAAGCAGGGGGGTASQKVYVKLGVSGRAALAAALQS